MYTIEGIIHIDTKTIILKLYELTNMSVNIFDSANDNYNVKKKNGISINEHI